MELRRYLQVVRRRLWLLVALALVGGIAGDLLTSEKAIYSSTATIYIGASNFSFNSPTGIQTGADQQLLTTTLIPTYAQMLRSEPIAADASSRVGLGVTAANISQDVTISSQTNTTLLIVSAKNANAAIAQSEANAVADSFTAKIQTLSNTSTPGSVPSAPAYVFQRAKISPAPLPSKTGSNIIKGALAGLVIAFGLVSLLEYLDVTIKGAEDAEAQFGLTVLGVVPLRSNA